MARKAKEEVLENKQLIEKVAESKKAVKAKATLKAKSSKSTDTTKTKAKVSSSKSTASKKAATGSKKATTKTATSKKSTTKSDSAKVASTKKTTKTASSKKATAKKSPSKKETLSKTSVKNGKDIESKKATTKKATAKKSTTKSTKKTTAKKTTSKKSTTKTTKRTTAKKTSKSISLDVIEYYDLPYRYNQTIIKVLAQNPNTLFVYWDISDVDIENFEKQYGNDFFTKTKPVLVVHNLTDNYTFEIDINDFANNWYINVNDTKCKYLVELGRRPIKNDFIDTPINYLNIAFSNTIEIPNDHILFFKENDKIYFKNIKTNKITEKVIKSFNHSLQGIYKTYNLSSEENDKFDRFDFKNPSSQNPTSTFL